MGGQSAVWSCMATEGQRTLLYFPEGVNDAGAECPAGATCHRVGNPRKSLEKRVFWCFRSGAAGFGWCILLHFLVVGFTWRLFH